MRRDTFLAMSAGFFTMPSAAAAQTSRTDAARAYFAAYRRRGDFSGVVAFRRGIEIDVLLDGTVSPGKAGLTRASRFMLGSISKHMTAVALLLLEEDGRLGLDDTVARFLPSYPRAGDMTLRQVALHRAGLGRDVPTPPGDTSVEGWVDASRTIPRSGEPGKTFAYSNVGYMVLAAVVERASGKPFAALLRDRVFEPNGMHATGDWSSGAHADLVDGGIPGLGTAVLPAPVRAASVIPGAGGIISSVDDMLRWDAALAGHGTLSVRLLERLTTPVDGYALGLSVGTSRGRRIIGHDGEKDGFAARFDRFPNDDAAYILLCNVETGALDAWRAALTALLFDEPAPQPNPAPSGVAFDADAARAFAGVYTVYPGFDMTIVARPDGLTLRATGSEVAAGLTPLGDRTFFFRLKYSTVTFAAPDNGRSPSLTWRDPGGEYLCKRAQ